MRGDRAIAVDKRTRPCSARAHTAVGKTDTKQVNKQPRSYPTVMCAMKKRKCDTEREALGVEERSAWCDEDGLY